MVKSILSIVAVVALVFGVVATANAWTQEECPTAETHPDCEQYFPSPTPSVTPSPETPGDGPTGVVEVDTPEVPREFGVGIGGSSGQ